MIKNVKMKWNEWNFAKYNNNDFFIRSSKNNPAFCFRVYVQEDGLMTCAWPRLPLMMLSPQLNTLPWPASQTRDKTLISLGPSTLLKYLAGNITNKALWRSNVPPRESCSWPMVSIPPTPNHVTFS